MYCCFCCYDTDLHQVIWSVGLTLNRIVGYRRRVAFTVYVLNGVIEGDFSCLEYNYGRRKKYTLFLSIYELYKSDACMNELQSEQKKKNL